MPECAIVLWLGCVFGTAMPEATVHEDCQLELWKNEIGFAKHRLMPSPAGNFVPSQ